MKNEKGKRNSEKVRTSILFTFSLLLFTCDAAVPLSWTVETTRVQPATFDVVRGETIELEAKFNNAGKPLAVDSWPFEIFWQTNGMGTSWWTAPATAAANRVTASFTPAMDPGAPTVIGFLGSTGQIYRAAFTLRFRHGPGAIPNALPLPQPVFDFATVEVRNQPWTAEIAAATNGIRKVDGSARPLPKYLHLYEADDSYPDAAAEYYRQRGSGIPSASCSSVRSGGFLCRNFDFPFDDRAEFVVRMSAGKDRFASVGVAQVGTNLTEQMVTSGKPEYSRLYKWLPGATVDGINEHGVACNINVVDGDPQTGGWHDTGDLHPLAAIRWILDNATNAQSAAQYIAANIRFPHGWTQNFHYMVASADPEDTWIVENGRAVWALDIFSGNDPKVMTNFRLYPRDDSGEGQERFEFLYHGSNITNAWYTHAYRRETNPPWVSDLADVIAYTNEIFDAWASHPKEYFRNKTNNGEPWWQTVHTSVYDISHRVLCVAVQETDDWYTFAVPLSGGVKVETDPTVPAWAKEANPPAVDAYTKQQTDAKLADKADAAEVPQMARNAMSAEGISSSGINIGGNISGATVSDQHGNLRTAIGSKVSQSDYDSEISSIWSSIGNKVDSSNGSASGLTVSDSMTIPSMDSVYTYGYDPSWGSWRDMSLNDAISYACSSYCSGYLYDGSSLGWTGLYFYDTAKIYLYDGWSAIVSGLTDTTLADVISEIDSTLRDHAGDYDNPHQVSPEQIGAITPSYISTNNPAFVSEVLATGMQLDPTAVAEFNEACRRGSLESNVVFHVRRYFQDTTASHYYWDPILQRTWQISVSNGCFFSAIVDDIR